MNVTIRSLALIILLHPLAALSQTPPDTTPPPPPETHDISKVDPAPEGGAIAVPFPEKGHRKLKNYETQELTGSRQAIGSQLIDGELPAPLLDYYVRDGDVDQRISIFAGGLVVVRMSAAGGVIQKRVIIPEDALKKYLQTATAAKLRRIRQDELPDPKEQQRAFLRIYEGGTFVERKFDPTRARPRVIDEEVGPLEDLLRAISEDRTVTSTVANYEPKVGDELVGDDQKVYRVQRIIRDDMVELRCVDQPTLIYVSKKDLYNYFVGRKAE